MLFVLFGLGWPFYLFLRKKQKKKKKTSRQHQLPFSKLKYLDIHIQSLSYTMFCETLTFTFSLEHLHFWFCKVFLIFAEVGHRTVVTLEMHLLAKVYFEIWVIPLTSVYLKTLLFTLAKCPGRQNRRAIS